MMRLYAVELPGYRTHNLHTARRRVLLPQRRLLTERKGREHLSLWLHRPRLCLSWYLPTEKLLITTGINSTCGRRPSHYTTPTIGLLLLLLAAAAAAAAAVAYSNRESCSQALQSTRKRGAV